MILTLLSEGTDTSAATIEVMGLALAALIQCFEWERISEEEVDMSRGSGITMPKAKPLEAMCKSRHSMSTLLSQL
ncbi:hypothetical protein QYF36_019787 [Acer negundo]|nr:hypothetical protein QYF36_019787 [Acer negundo]